MFSGSNYRDIFASDTFATIVVTCAIFTDSFVYDLIIPFLPQLLEKRLGLPGNRIQRWTSILLAVFGGTLLISNVAAGYLTDRFTSKKRPFLLGLVCMTVASLLFFLGTHIAVAIVARAFQGMSAALVWVSGLAFLTSHVEAKNLSQAMSWMSIGTAAGELTGPVVGGVLYENAGHWGVMALVMAVLGIDVVLRILLADKPERGKEDGETNDEEEALLDGDGASHDGPTRSNGLLGWGAQDDVQDPGALDEPGLDRPILPRLDQDVRDLIASFFAVAMTGIVRFSLEATLVLFVQTRFHWSTSFSSLIILAFLAPTVVAPLTGRVTQKFGPRWSSVAAFAASAALLIVLGFLTEDSRANQMSYVAVVAGLGLCIAVLTTSHTIAFSATAKRREDRAKKEGHEKTTSTGLSFGGLNVAWAVGMFAGPVLADVFLENKGWQALCVFLAALCGASSIMSGFTWTRWLAPGEE